MPGGITADRGSRGLTFEDKALRTRGAAWLEPTGGAVLFDDFLGDTLNANVWLATEVATGVPWAVSATAGDPVAGHGGWAAAQTDNVDAGSEELAAGSSATVGQFRADRAGNGMLVFQCRTTIPGALTARYYNFGLTYDPTEGSALAMSISGTTWTTTATDAALAVFSSAATDNDNFLFQTVDSDADGTHVASTVAAAANSARIIRIEIDSAGGCHFYETSDNYITRDNLQGVETAVGVSPDVLLAPYVAAAATTTTAVDVEIDYVFTACGR